MEELERLVERARGGDLEAFGQIVGRFQDMAYGCAYAVVGDFHLAQDVAQEAFLEAYRSLENLRESKAFPGWFRRIILHSCNRLTRRRQPELVSMERMAVVPATSEEPAEEMDRQEMKENVLAAIKALPEHERMVTTLFYINGYSQADIAGFLEVPVTTVKSRLHTSRTRLKERMMNMVAEELKSSKPGPELARTVLRRVSAVEVRPEFSEKHGRVLLVAEDGRCVVANIGLTEEAAIERGLKNKTPPRPQTHELLLSVLKAFDISVVEAQITELRNATFFAELVLKRKERVERLDARPSDCIVLAIFTGTKLSITEAVLNEAGPRDKAGNRIPAERFWQCLRDGCIADDLK